MKDLRKVVPPKREILRGIYLSFFHGAKIGVLGANGAGKSSLLRIMAGVDRDFLGEAFPADGLRIQEFLCGDRHTDAYILGKMHIGHHCNLLNVWSAPEALNRLRHLVTQWRSQPSADRSQFYLTHHCLRR